MQLEAHQLRRREHLLLAAEEHVAVSVAEVGAGRQAGDLDRVIRIGIGHEVRRDGDPDRRVFQRGLMSGGRRTPPG
jgi:hypothetical protein